MIFANVRNINASADANPESLRISVDTKATVNVGEYSRGGKSRGITAVAALDHDMPPNEKLIPGGILETVSGKSFLFFGNSCKTSDFLADGILMWWKERQQELSHIKHLVVNMDNGPECNGHRSQFLYRMAKFADSTGLTVQLVYYPPYHSKYNGIERFWAGLEKSWNGYLLDSVITVGNLRKPIYIYEVKNRERLVATYGSSLIFVSHLKVAKNRCFVPSLSHILHLISVFFYLGHSYPLMNTYRFMLYAIFLAVTSRVTRSIP